MIFKNRILVAPFALTFFLVLNQLLLNWFRVPSYNNINGVAYKDAANWELCSKSLAEYGLFPVNISDWCLRRPINIEILAFIFRITNSMFFIYFILNFIFVIILFWSYSKFSKILSRLQSLILGLTVFGLWAIFANNMVLSESIGLILGTLSLGVMSNLYVTNDVKNILFLGITLTLIQIVRPGNLISPFLLILLIPMVRSNFKSRFLSGLFLFLLPVVLPSSIKYFSKLFSYDNYLTGGNAWASVYGLVNKNITWQEAYARVPANVGNSEIAINQYLKNQTLTDMREHPFTLVSSIFQNLFSLLTDTFPFFSPVTISLSGIFSMFLIFSYILFIFIFIRNLNRRTITIHLKLFTVFFVITTFFFYSLTWKSEPARSLSPTFPLFVLLIFFIFSKNSGTTTPASFTLGRSLKYYVTVAVLPFVFIATLISINRTPDRESQLLENSSICKSNEFVFDGNTLSSTSIESIKTFRAFGWSNLIDQLPNGYLIQGITNFGNQPFAVTGFLETNKHYTKQQIVDSCFVFNTNSTTASALDELNFVALEIPI